MALELLMSEEACEKIWTDEIFLSLIQGCNHVVVRLDARRDDLAVAPVGVVFDDWEIALGDGLTTELVLIANIVPRPREEVEDSG